MCHDQNSMDISSIRPLRHWLCSWIAAVLVVGSDVPVGTAGSQTGRRLVVRVRIANGAMHKVRVKPCDSIEAVRLSAGEPGPLYRDAYCSMMMDETQSVEQAGLSQGDVLYAKPVVKPRMAQLEERWEPYPAFSKRRRRFRSSARVKTLKDLAAETHELSGEAERVCREARVDATAIETFAAAQPTGSWSVFGRRLDDGAVECNVVCPESLPFAAELAAKLGLEPVGCAFVADKVGSFVASKGAAAQVEAMRRLGRSGTFPFVTLLVSQHDQVAVEAFEISEIFVQIVAENLLVDTNDDDFIQLSVPAIVDKRETTTFDTAWVYRPVPIVSIQSDFKTSVYDETPDSTVIAAALGPYLDDRRALAARCIDFALLLRLRHRLTRADFELLCDAIRSTRCGAADHLPQNLVAVIKRIVQSPTMTAYDGDAEKNTRTPPFPSKRRRRNP